jgi:nitrite reductase/ring-hydroxylating ferredoxin subunit
MPETETKLCMLEDIADSDAIGMVARIEGKQRNIFIARLGDAAYAYLNWCPHTQVLLDQVPGKFFDRRHNYIICGMHAARFRVADGFCIGGPCEGESLKPVQIEIQEGTVYLLE